MASKKFNIDGREYCDYQLSNEQIVQLIEGMTSMSEKAFLKEKAYARFKYDLCKHNGEENENVFVRFFSNFVNGKCGSKKRVAELMACEHRYLQNEMFKVCLEYIKKLAENCEKGYYDPRNEYACKTSKMIIDNFKENNYPY